MILSVKTIIVGFMDGVEGVCVIVNKGTPTETVLSIRMWTALNAGVELTRRAAILISDSQGNVPVQASAEEIRRMDS
jgi:hypothetical protein